MSVLLLDRASFPRDKACGDGVAPHVLDLLSEVGVDGLVDDMVPVSRLRLSRGEATVARTMARPAWVVPRTVLDHRLLETARAAGAHVEHHRARALDTQPGDLVRVDDVAAARLVVGADGAQSVVRRTLGLPRGRTALALRGYAPTPAARRGEQTIVFGTNRQPSYAWCFDRGDGMANVGYGEVLTEQRPAPARPALIEELERLLPGATTGASDWRGHQLPLSSWAWAHPSGRVLLAGDAAGLVNPLTGEGIYHAVLSGLLAGRVAAATLARGDPYHAGTSYRRAVHTMLGRHRQHTAVAARLAARSGVVHAGLRAAAADPKVFQDLVELGLGRGSLTRPVLRGLARELLGR